MKDSRILHLNVRLDSKEPLSPLDAIGLFECTEDYARSIFLSETSDLLKFLKLIDESRIENIQYLNKLGRKLPIPAEIKSFKKGSWTTDILISGISILLIKDFLVPVMQDAFNDSEIRDRMYIFFREKVFKGAKKNVDFKAMQYKKYRTLRVRKVNEEFPGKFNSDVSFSIELSKDKIIDTVLTDEELLEGFLERIKNK
ncbi:hypothetical protein ACFL6I_08650 [candidate division KSB1 bacterium]